MFLKLLEAQLYHFHKEDSSFKFLDKTRIPHFKELNYLFFRVLAVTPANRDSPFKEDYPLVPYLNSSLFEPNDLEKQGIDISNLNDKLNLAYTGSTELKDDKGKKTQRRG